MSKITPAPEDILRMEQEANMGRDEIIEEIKHEMESFAKTFKLELMENSPDFSYTTIDLHKYAAKILKTQSPTHRIAIVRKKPDYPSEFSEEDRIFLLFAGFVQEEKE